MDVFKRAQIAQEKAENLILKTLGIALDDIYLDPTTEAYGSDIQVFKLLFAQAEEDYRLALWNSLFWFGSEDGVLQEDLTEEEYAFYRRYQEAYHAYRVPFQTNINQPFKSTRLLFRPTNGDADVELYQKHLKEDGDFTLFTSLKCTRDNIRRLGFDRPFFFVIEEKHSGNMIGYVGLRWEKNNGEQTQVMECEYYIFKPYRNKGYAREALTGICERAFAEKLFELKDTQYNYVCHRKRAKPLLIRAMIREDNVGSRALVEACGFEYTGVLHRHYMVEDKYTVNCTVYELTKEEQQERNR